MEARSPGVQGPRSRRQTVAAVAAAGAPAVSNPGTQVPLGAADQPAGAAKTSSNSTVTDSNLSGNTTLGADQRHTAANGENAEGGPAVGELPEACAACAVVRDPDPLAAVSKGITLRGLRRLAARMRCFFGATWDTVSTAQVNTQFVQAATCAHRCRLAELPCLVDPRDVGVPRYFISHAWKNSFALLLRSIEGFLESADEETLVWIDIIAVNQHTDSGGHQSSDMAAFKHVVASASGGTLVVMDLSSCNPATRAWCVYEWADTLATHGSDGLHMPLAATDRAALIASLDVAAAECSHAADKEMILEHVVACHGSVQEFNDRLKLQLLLQPLSYRVDLRRLGGRAKAGGMAAAAVTGAVGSAALTQGGVCGIGAAGGSSWEWDWSRVEERLGWFGERGGSSGGAGGRGRIPRALCVLAGPGEGKSTFSAALCEASDAAAAAVEAEALQQLPSSCNGHNGGNESGKHTGGSSAPPVCVTAYHLIKYSDQRRLDPLKALASLAFQLALRLPRFRRHLLSADIPSLVTLEDPKPAFRTLIHEPLRKALQEGAEEAADTRPAPSEQIVILIDALDEADPPSAPPAAPSAAAAAAAEPAARPPPSPMPPVCGNKMFQLLAKQLLSLPPCVRFILTSRPDGLGGGITAALDRLFGPGGVVYVSPGQLRHGSGSKGGGGSGGDGAMGHTAEGGATKQGGEAGYAEAASAPGTRAATAKTGVERIRAGGGSGTGGTSGANASLSAAAKEGSSGGGNGEGDSGGGVLVYYTVIAECFGGKGQQAQMPEGAAAPAPLAIQQPPPPPAGPPTLSDLHRAYAAVFDAGMASLGSARSAHGSPPKRLTHGSPGSPGKPSGPSGSPQHRAVRRLLSVLLAAQEPLPESLLGSMGLGPRVLSRLPGWPVMFYLEEHRAYVMHKSLSDWLADPRVSGRHAVDLRRGHRLLARRLLAAVERGNGGGGGGGGSGGGVSVEFTPYALQYLVRHLVAAAEWAPLERLMLQNHAFLAAAFGQGHGHALLRDLMAAPKALAAGDGCSCTSATAAAITDALRWLLGQQHVLFGERSAADVTVNALHAPTRTAVFRAAEEMTLAAAAAAGRPRWRLRHALGASPGWPAITTTLKVQGQDWCVLCLKWSPDGSCLATGDEAGALRLWDAGSGECLAELQAPAPADRRFPDAVRSLAWSPDGRTLASGGSDTHVRLWDTATGGCTAVLKEHKSRVTHLAWSPGGRALLSGAAGEGLLFWKAATGGRARCVKQLPDASMRCVAWAPDGKLLVIGCEKGKFQLFDVESGCVRSRLKYLSNDPTCLAWSPDGSRLAVGLDGGERENGEARIYNLCSTTSRPQGLPRLQRQIVLKHEWSVNQVAWSPDGQVLASCCSLHKVALWSARSGARITTLQMTQFPYACVALLAWSPCGGALAAGGGNDGSVRLWDVGAAVAAAEAKAAEESRLASLQPAGQRQQQQQQASSQVPPSGGHTVSVDCLAWRPDGSQLASAGQDGSLRLWDAAAGECTAVLLSPPPAQGGEEEEVAVFSVAWSPDGRRLASGGRDRAVRIWDAASGKCTATLKGHSRCVWGVAWAPRGAGPQPPRLLASCGQDGELRVWDVTTKACTATLKGHSEAVLCLDWSPDGGCLASGSCDRTVRLWDAAGGTCTAVLEGHSYWVRCVAWAPSGPGSPALLASGSYDTTIRLWDAAARTCTAVLQGHSGCVTCVEWSPDASHLANGCGDGTVRVWALHRGTGADRGAGDTGHQHQGGGGSSGGGAGGECVAVLQSQSDSVTCVAWSPDGRTLASGANNSIWVYELEA